MKPLSETEFGLRTDDGGFKPNMWVNISGGFLDKKLEIMDIYKSEVGDFPFPRSQKNIRALANLRACTVNLTEAEAFMSLKTIL